jgi:hypothetical protein
MLTVYPGEPPDGHVDLKVPPARMHEGDQLLLAGRIRIVLHPKFYAAGQLTVVMLYSSTAGPAAVDEWRPETRDLPIAIWRPRRDARRAAPTTEGRPTGAFLTKAAQLSSGDDLGSRVIHGIREIQKLPDEDDRVPQGREGTRFFGFDRIQSEPAAVAAALERF